MPDNTEITHSELVFLGRLTELGVRFLVIGNGAAVIQGADVVTKDLDLWFDSLSDPGVDAAARKAGGIFMWRAMPPIISGPDLDHIDLVTCPNGLDSFNREYANAHDWDFYGIQLKVLPLDRVIASKEAADRPKDRVVLPALRAALGRSR